jgi:hypothetical protein
LAHACHGKELFASVLFFKNAVPVFSSLILVVLGTILLSTGSAYAHEGTAEQHFAPAQEEINGEEFQAGSRTSGSEVLYFPSGSLYEPYLADPHRIGFALRVLHYSRTGIPHAGDTRFYLKSGGQFGLVRMQPRDAGYPAWQLGLEAAFVSQFDIEEKLDNIGWDGRYGFVLTTARSRNLSMRFGYLHDSSHVGDEYAERNGRLRIGYTREEVAAGISWLSDVGWRTYAEYAHGVVLRNENQKAGRAQIGLEWQQPKRGQGHYRGWYAAADLSSMQEREWKIDVALQAGYRIDNTTKTWRFGVDWYSGRPPIGEFFQHTESYLGFGIWVDI